MAGDLGIRERVVVLPDTRALGAAPALETDSSRRVVHVYGARVVVMEEGPADDVRAQAESTPASPAVLQSLSEEERLGYGAYHAAGVGRVPIGKVGPPTRWRKLGCRPRDVVHAARGGATGVLRLARWGKA